MLRPCPLPLKQLGIPFQARQGSAQLVTGQTDKGVFPLFQRTPFSHHCCQKQGRDCRNPHKGLQEEQPERKVATGEWGDTQDCPDNGQTGEDYQGKSRATRTKAQRSPGQRREDQIGDGISPLARMRQAQKGNEANAEDKQAQEAQFHQAFSRSCGV